MVLENLYDAVASGGWVIIDDYDVNFGLRPGSETTKGASHAVDEFRREKGVQSPLTRKYGKVAWRKP